MSASSFALTILTPTGKIFEHDHVKVLTAKTTEGEISVLPHHAPLFTRLEHDELKVKLDEEIRYFTIFQGFINVDPDNHVTVMADTANRSEELDIEAIKKAKAAAEKALSEKEKLSATELLRAETAMRRAIMELKVAEKKLHRG